METNIYNLNAEIMRRKKQVEKLKEEKKCLLDALELASEYVDDAEVMSQVAYAIKKAKELSEC